jgi:hypothetical protein
MEICYEDDKGEPETVKKVDLDIEVNGQKQTWRITVTHSQRSLYGQLVMLAKELGGLTDKTVKVMRQGSGRGTTYTVTAASG